MEFICSTTLCVEVHHVFCIYQNQVAVFILFSTTVQAHPCFLDTFRGEPRQVR